MEEFYNKHYILIDTSNNIIDGWSDGPLPNKDTSQAICINREGGYQFRLFPQQEENPTLMTMDGIYLYKYEDGTPKAKTAAEIKVERAINLNRQLPTIKKQIIAKSKTDLAQYLEVHPYTWLDGKQYSATQEKQALLTEQLGLYAIDPDTPLYWNASGEECTVWTIENLSSLAKGIANYVRPYVQYQQKKEKEVDATETVDEVYEVVIDYNEV